MKLETRFAEPQDLPEIKRQIDEYISPDDYTLEELQAILRREGTLFYVMTDAVFYMKELADPENGGQP